MTHKSDIGKVMEMLNRPVEQYEELIVGDWQFNFDEVHPRSWNLTYGDETVLLRTLDQGTNSMPAYSWIIWTRVPVQVNMVLKRMNIPIRMRRLNFSDVEITAPLRTFTVTDAYYTLSELLSGELIDET